MSCDVSHVFREFANAKAMAEQCVAENRKTYHVVEDCVSGDEGGYFCEYKVAEGVGIAKTTFYPPEQYEAWRNQLVAMGLWTSFLGNK